MGHRYGAPHSRNVRENWYPPFAVACVPIIQFVGPGYGVVVCTCYCCCKRCRRTALLGRCTVNSACVNLRHSCMARIRPSWFWRRNQLDVYRHQLDACVCLCVCLRARCVCELRWKCGEYHIFASQAINSTVPTGVFGREIRIFYVCPPFAQFTVPPGVALENGSTTFRQTILND